MKKITYFGIPGSNSFLAAYKMFSTTAKFISKNSVFDCVNSVSADLADFSVIPLENSLTGSLADSYDALRESNVSIVAEIILQIHHHFLAGGISAIKNCYSHPQAFNQCRNFFIKNPQLKQIPAFDTASAAKIVSEKKNSAAVANALAAKIYKLKILKKNIEDNKANFSRFIVVGKKQNKNGNKISLLFKVSHKPGSLFSALSPYKKLGLNLSKIESRPIAGSPWEYIFILDFELSAAKFKLQRLLSLMKKKVIYLKILGRYDKGKVYET